LLFYQLIYFEVMKKSIFILICTILTTSLFAQKGIVRGNVFDQSGQPVGFANVILKGTSKATTSDNEGFYNMSGIEAGRYTLIATFIGYDTAMVEINLKAGAIINQRLTIKESGQTLNEVSVTAQKKDIARTEVQVSKVTITPKQIKSLPSTGGDADIAQYLAVLPGVVFTGDQGGQLYIRGGSPVQNKILLDGMTIYNPFHSIGFYSVFETEAIRSVDVYTGGFNADQGGRISAVVDIKTREGNKKNFGGNVSVSPFQSKILIEGPIVKLKEDNGTSVSFLLTGKQSYIDKTSTNLYKYAAKDSSGLPFTFRDTYGKISVVAGNGSKINLFGFNFTDRVNFTNVADIGWNSTGGGINFTLIPSLSNLIIGGRVTYSDYQSAINDADKKPRKSGIAGYNAGLDFTYFGANNEVKYGFDLNGFRTNFSYVNIANQTFTQDDNTTEIAAFMKYRQKIGRFVIDPGVRFQYYASLNEVSIEPRLGLKWNITKKLRFKFASGMYSQNLISTVNEKDVVNLFVGFLSGPSKVFELNTKKEVASKLQRSIQAIAGFEIDVNDNLDLNVEPYYKRFTQLIGINRNKLSVTDSDYSTEKGEAYGIDFSAKYQTKNIYLWVTYSHGYVNRFDGKETYPTIFDRRNNINTLATYQFGKKRAWEASVRWNLGTGFPFTLTQGFYGQQGFPDGAQTNVGTNNPELGIIYAGERNGGRLPTYHRMDASLKRTFKFGKRAKLEINASATNVYNRQNIFYFDRIRYTRVNQLPILPTLSMNFGF
jgi:hypothetical protein